MKIKNILLCSTVLAPVLLSATIVNATEYPDSSTAKTDAIIQFEKDDQPMPPVDPEDPTKPIDPLEPENPHGAELMITYASKLNFGTHKNSETSFSALGDEMRDGSYITPIVSIKDSRGTERAGWTLTAKIDGDFKDSKDNILKGAELIFSNLYSGSGQAASPNVITSTLTLSTQETVIAGAGVTNGSGQHSIGLGKLDAVTNTTNGVTLRVPNGTAINADQYKTTITYNLTADPFSISQNP